MKLRCAVSLGLGIKGVKIARNAVKVGVHEYKLVKSETRRPVSLGFGLKEVEITSNMANVGVHSCL